MKTKELIKRLNDADPTGEAEVCVDNTDILFVEALPAYYDGYLQVLIRDKTKEPYYNVVGAKYVNEGKKVCIHQHSIEDAIIENPELPVDLPDGSPVNNKYYLALLEQYRCEALEE